MNCGEEFFPAEIIYNDNLIIVCLTAKSVIMIFKSLANKKKALDIGKNEGPFIYLLVCAIYVHLGGKRGNPLEIEEILL